MGFDYKAIAAGCIIFVVLYFLRLTYIIDYINLIIWLAIVFGLILLGVFKFTHKEKQEGKEWQKEKTYQEK